MSFLDGLKDFGKGALTVAGGGATDPQYSVDPNTGQTVTTQQPRSTGDMFKSMFAGMLSGLAGGVNAHANGGPGGGLAAFANGAQANNQRLRQVDQQKRQQAQTQFDDSQKAIATQGVKAQQSLDMAIKTFRLAADKTAFRQADLETSNRMEDVLQKHPGSTELGIYKDPNAYLQTSTPEHQQQIREQMARGEIQFTSVTDYDKDGNPYAVGVKAYHIKPGSDEKPIDRDIQVGIEHHLDKDGVDHPTPVIAKAGSITFGQAYAMNAKNLAGEVSSKDVFNQAGKERVETLKAQAAERRQQAHDDAMMQRQQEHDDALAKQREPIAGDARQKLIDSLGNYKGDISHLRSYMSRVNDPGLESEVADKYPGWSVPRFEAAKKTMQSFTGNGKDAQNMLAIGAATQHFSSLLDLAKHLPDTNNIKVLNQFVASTARNVGNSDVTSYEALAHALKEEAGKSFKGGVPDIQQSEQLDKDLSVNLSPKQMIGNATTFVHAFHQRAGELAGQYRNDVPNATTDPYGPNFSKGAEAAFNKFGLDNPFNFGAGPKPENGGNTSLSAAPRYIAEQFYKIANGDKDKARQLAASRGWTQ